MLPEGTKWLKYAPAVHRLAMNTALQLFLEAFLHCHQLPISCYTHLPQHTPICEYTVPLEALIPWKHSNLAKPRGMATDHPSAFTPNAVLVDSYFYPVIVLLHVRRNALRSARSVSQLTFAVLFSNTACLVYDACKFSSTGYAQQSKRGDQAFYKIPDHPFHCGAEESITMHTDCFQLCSQAFKSYRHDSDCNGDYKENFRRLWLTATWRYASKTMAPLKLPSYSALMDPSPSLISKLCGFKREFLPEIASIIQSYSQSSILWRFDAVLQLAEELNFAKTNEEEKEEAATCSLSQVLCWSRGSSPKFVQDEFVDPFVCLIIDSRGIKSINRISALSASTAAYVSVYPNVLIIEPVETITSTEIEFKVCNMDTCILTLLQHVAY